MAKFKVLVAGGSGQVARALVDTAPLAVADVVALGRPQLDLTDPASIEAAVRAAAPDIVVSAAATRLAIRQNRKRRRPRRSTPTARSDWQPQRLRSVRRSCNCRLTTLSPETNSRRMSRPNRWD